MTVGGRLAVTAAVPVLLFATWAGLQSMEDLAEAAAIEAHQKRWNCLVEQDKTIPACSLPSVARSEDADRCPEAVAACRASGLYAQADASIVSLNRWSFATSWALMAALLALIALVLWQGASRLRRRSACL